MPNASISIDWGVLGSVGIMAAKQYRDGLARGCGYLEALESKPGGRAKWDAGLLYDCELNMVNATGITQFGTGYEAFDPTMVEGSRVAQYRPGLSGLLMKIGAKEGLVYTSADAMAPKVKKIQDACMGFLKRSFTQRTIAGLGAGFTDWYTLNGIDYATGVFERSAVGSQSNTIGGLSKSTYSNVIGWNNVIVDMNNAWGSNLTSLYSAITSVKEHKSDLKSKVWLFSQAGMNNIKRSVQANERYFITGQLDAGVPVELYHNIKIFQENFMPVSTATGGSSTNTYPITAYLLDADDIFTVWSTKYKFGDVTVPDGYFGIGDWRQVSGEQIVACCPMMVGGANIIADMGSSAAVIRGQTF